MNKNIRFLAGLFGTIGLGYGAFVTFSTDSIWFSIWVIMLVLWLTGWYLSWFISSHKLDLVKCTRCNAIVYSGLKFCHYCRSPLEQKISIAYCVSNHKHLEDDNLFVC